MALVFITGSTDGLGRASADGLLDKGHRVVLHARSPKRVEALGELGRRAWSSATLPARPRRARWPNRSMRSGGWMR